MKSSENAVLRNPEPDTDEEIRHVQEFKQLFAKMTGATKPVQRSRAYKEKMTQAWLTMVDKTAHVKNFHS